MVVKILREFQANGNRNSRANIQYTRGETLTSKTVGGGFVETKSPVFQERHVGGSFLSILIHIHTQGLNVWPQNDFGSRKLACTAPSDDAFVATLKRSQSYTC